MRNEDILNSIDLKLVRDTPISDDEKTQFDNSEDYFNHESYANTIKKLIQDNDVPITIGLFGSWGVGKSSIINILKKKSKEQPKKPNEINQERKFDIIVFNAWKYSGDSFRREFLMQLANSKVFFRCEFQRNDYKDKLNDLFHSRVEVKNSKKNLVLTVINIAILLIFSLLILLDFTDSFDIQKYTNEGALAAAIIAAIINIFYMQFSKVLTIFEKKEYKNQLLYPEQFEDKLKEIFTYKVSKDKDVVVVIDDLDRCEPETILDSLMVVKTFLNSKDINWGKINKPYFIIPIDDQAVLRAKFSFYYNSDISDKEDMTYEQFRKYFDVTVKINPILQNDLLTLARNFSIDYPKEFKNAIFIGVYGDCRDARKLKHFINHYNIKLKLLQNRSERGHFNQDKILKNLDLIALLTILEIQFPIFFLKVLKKPSLLSLERETIITRKQLVKVEGNQDIYNIPTNNNLEMLLLVTSYIKLEDLEILLSMKISEQMKDLNVFGKAIYNYFHSSSLNEYTELDNLIKDESLSKIPDVLNEYLNHDVPIIQYKAISLCFVLIEKFISNGINPEMVFKEFFQFFKILSVDEKIELKYDSGAKFGLNLIIENFEHLDFNFREKLSKKIVMDNLITSFNLKFASLFNIGYLKDYIIEEKEKINSIIEKKYFESEIEIKERIISELNNINELNIFNIPSDDFISTIILNIFSKYDDDHFSYYNVIVDFLISYKINLSDIHYSQLSNYVCLEFKNEFEKKRKYSPKMELIKRILIHKPDWVIKKDAKVILDIIQQFRDDILSDEECKVNSIIVELVCLISYIKDENYTRTAIDRIINNRSFLFYIATLRFSEVVNGFIQTFPKDFILFWEKVFPEIINLRFNRIIENRYFLDNDINPEAISIYEQVNDNNISKKFKDFLNNSIKTQNLAVIRRWKKCFEHIVIKKPISDISKSIIKTIIEMIILISPDKNYRIEIGSIIKIALNENHLLINPQDVLLILRWLESDDEFLRQFSKENFETIKDILIKTEIETEVPSIFDNIIKKDILRNFKDSIDICLGYKNKIKSISWERLSEKIELDLKNQNLQIKDKLYLIELVNKIQKKAKWFKELIVKLEINDYNEPNIQIKEAIRVLLSSLQNFDKEKI